MENTMIAEKQPLTEEYLQKMDAYWRAANYLAAAQLYLLDNPLLRRPCLLYTSHSCLSVFAEVFCERNHDWGREGLTGIGTQLQQNARRNAQPGGCWTASFKLLIDAVLQENAISREG